MRHRAWWSLVEEPNNSIQLQVFCHITGFTSPSQGYNSRQIIIIMMSALLCKTVLTGLHVTGKNFSLSLSTLTAIFPGEAGLAGYIGAKGNGSGVDNCSYKTSKDPVKSSPPTNQHPTFYRPDALPVTQRTVSKHWREMWGKFLCGQNELILI